ncbi:MAG: radical SAM protein [Alphaproteobacteria bacterium]|nr:radical SAM protein [Alphaproteobacteria bacterium]
MAPIKVNTVQVKDYLVKSNMKIIDYTINPYIGCPHACKYCYASYMRRFTNHDNEPWGSFIDIKLCDKQINTKKLHCKTVFIASVTDCYNPFEAKYCITRSILQQLVGVDCNIIIVTKSSLILRDIEILKQLKSLKVGLSINTLDERFKNDMDRASSIKDRLNTLRTLYENNIYTFLFMSPIFPGITNYEEIINISKKYINEYWFENLNLRGDYKYKILKYINIKYPQLNDLYKEIYIKSKNEYWQQLANEIEKYCVNNLIKHSISFNHKELVKNK